MEHLNKICALAHIQEILDVTAKVTDEDTRDIVMNELMRECADLALVTNQQNKGKYSFRIEPLEYHLQRINTKIRRVRQEYLNDKIPTWLAKIERDTDIESNLKLAGVVADCFAKDRAEKIGIKYADLLNERSKKFKDINLDYKATPEVCPAYNNPRSFNNVYA